MIGGYIIIYYYILCSINPSKSVNLLYWVCVRAVWSDLIAGDQILIQIVLNPDLSIKVERDKKKYIVCTE